MANVNEVVFNGNTLISLKNDTATAADVAQGKTFHLASGASATGTASVGDAFTLLWANDELSTNFAAQTIQFDLSAYDAVSIYSKFRSSYGDTFPSYSRRSGSKEYIDMQNHALIKKGASGLLVMGAEFYTSTDYIPQGIAAREVSVSASGVTFGDCHYRDGSQTLTLNYYAYPLRIYGVKTSVNLP